MGPLIVIAILPLFMVTFRHARAWGLWGVVYMGVLHGFLLRVHEFSSIPIAIFLWLIASIYFGAFYWLGGIIMHSVHRIFPTYTQLSIPVVFLVIDWLKLCNPFPNPLGNMGYALAPVIDWVHGYAIFGVWGMGFLVTLTSFFIRHLLTTSTKGVHSVGVISCVLLIIGPPIHPPIHQWLRISVIQTSINQHHKLNHSFWPNIQDTYLALIEQARGELVILPESILPTTLVNQPIYASLTDISTRQHILFGTFIQQNNQYTNGTLLLSPNSAIAYMYHKRHLMPFGEYLPLRFLLEPLIPDRFQWRDFDRGATLPPVQINGIPIDQRICLEGIYPQKPRGRLMSIVANNAWFDQTRAGNKLRQFAHVHAQTYGIPVALSANKGFSAMINYDGRILAAANHFDADILTADVPIPSKASLYHRCPSIGGIILFIIGVTTWWMYRRFDSHPNTRAHSFDS